MHCQPEAQVLLAPYTTLQVGGSAEWLVTVTNIAELQAAVRWAQVRDLPITLIAGGSNVQIGDAGIPGLVIRILLGGVEVKKSTNDTILIRAGAGAVLDDVVAMTVEQGWWGLENLSHIPGSVGATPIQNVGAYGVEVGDLIESVEVYDIKADTLRTFSVFDCQFGYRDSIFKTSEGRSVCIIAVTFRLHTKPSPRLTYVDLAERLSDQTGLTPAQVRKEVCRIRAKKFPDWHTVGTAGSFFKNPIISNTQAKEIIKRYPELPVYALAGEQVKVPLGWILDKICGLRGYRDGALGLYKQQALVLVNYGGATSAEIDTFASYIQDVVYTHTGICIQHEVTRLPQQ